MIPIELYRVAWLTDSAVAYPSLLGEEYGVLLMIKAFKQLEMFGWDTPWTQIRY